MFVKLPFSTPFELDGLTQNHFSGIIFTHFCFDEQGVQACSFYLQRGRCKFGRTCKFDHPMGDGKYNSTSSYSEMPGNS